MSQTVAGLAESIQSATSTCIDTRVDVLGVGVSPLTISRALNCVDSWIRDDRPNYVCVTGVHGIMECQDDLDLLRIHNQAGMVTPDGMPLVWLCRRRGHPETERVYGPDFMLACCGESVSRGWKHFLYGGADGVADLLADRLRQRFPGLQIVGTHTPPFRPLTPQEDLEVCHEIDESGADIVWVGLSTPKQERWMAAHLGQIRTPVMIGVGAAFDFHSGRKTQAPAWMQRSGLEWLYRLLQEPRRLGRRYLSNNPRFVARIAADTARSSKFMGTVQKWGARGSWAILDQGLFSVANFSLNLLLARWLIPDDYGAFAVAYSAFLLIGALHSGLLVEPMLVFGPGLYRDHLGRYLRSLNIGNLAVSAGSGLILLAAAIVARFTAPPILSQALLGLAIGGPGILLLWLARRMCYVRLEPRLAVASGTAYLVLVLAGTAALHHLQILTPLSALIWVGLSSALSALWLLKRLPIDWTPPTTSDGFTREVTAAHWNYGRWAIATGILIWIPGQIYYLLLPLWGGLEAAGVLKAMTNLIMPILHPYASVGVLLTPALVRARDTGHFNRVVRWGTLVFAAGALIYWAVLAVAGELLIDWIYGGEYSSHAELLLIVGSIPVAGSAVSILGPALRAMERPDLVFRAYLVSTLLALTLGIGLIAYAGAAGAAAGIAVSSAAVSVTLAILLYRLRNNQRPIPDSSQRTSEMKGKN